MEILTELIQKNTLQLFSNSNFKSFKIQNQNQKLNIFRLKKEIKSLETEKILLGNGLLPPKKLKLIKRIIINIYGIFILRGYG